MSIVRYDPFRDLRNLHEEVNRLFTGNIGRTFDDDGIAEPDRRNDQYGGEDIGQNVADDDTPGGSAGGVGRIAVQRMLVHILELTEPITQDNVADAVAIALTHAQRVKFVAAVASAT